MQRRLENSARKHGMNLTAEKSNILKMGYDENVTVTIEREQLETVDQFKYLGSTITENAKPAKKVKIRIAIAHLPLQV